MASFGVLHAVASTEGTVPFSISGETYQTWYRVHGDLSTSTHTPVVIVHGGPGLTHDYLLPISDLYTKFSIPVVFYDQLGNGRSTHLRDLPGPPKSSSFWSMNLFLDELSNLLEHLGIADSFDLLGQSYGGMLAAQFAAERRPAGLRHLILSNSFASMHLWNQSLRDLSRAFPENIQQGLALGLSDVPKYQDALMQFYDVHGLTLKPRPPEFDRTFEQVFGENGDVTVGAAMFPVLEDWTVIPRLHCIEAPTLVINGRNDFASESCSKPFFDHIHKVKWLVLDNSSHMPFWEEREKYMEAVASFLRL